MTQKSPQKGSKILGRGHRFYKASRPTPHQWKKFTWWRPWCRYHFDRGFQCKSTRVTYLLHESPNSFLYRLNDTHMEERVLHWKNSLKWKVGCFWCMFTQFNYTLFIRLLGQLNSFNSIIVQMSENCDSSNRQ